MNHRKYSGPPPDQLLLHDGITMSVQEQKSFPERAVRMVITLFGSVGTLLTITGFFDFGVDVRSLLLLVFTMTFFLRLIRMISPKVGFAVILLSFAGIPLLLIRYRKAAVVGAGAIYNVIRQKILWEGVFPASPAYGGGWTRAQCVQFVFILIVIALVALLEYSDVLMTHPQSSRSGFLIRFLVTFPFLEIGLYFGLETKSIYIFMMIFFWIGTRAVARLQPSKKLKEQQGASASLQYAFSSETEQRFTTHESGALILLTAIGVFAAAVMLIGSRYVRSEEMNQRRQELRQFYKSISIDDVTGLLEQLPGTFGVKVEQDEIDLRKNHELKFDGSIVMHASLGAALKPDDYYLRGVVRGEYNGSGWQLPVSAYRSGRRLFERLTTENCMPQSIFHSGHLDDLKGEDGRFPVVRAEISMKIDMENNFVPYQGIFDLGTQYRYDTEIELDDHMNYGYWIINRVTADWEKFSETSAPSDVPLISEYEQFVDDTYLAVPDTPAMQRMQEAFTVSGEMPSPDDNLTVKLEKIQSYLWSRAVYDPAPGPQPAEEDYVEYFLTVSHKGFCAHYASAAVLLCRMSGIPARYCQGYVIPQASFRGTKSGDTYEIDLQDYQAHAWAEVYVKGYGWIPYEFTETVAEAWHSTEDEDEEPPPPDTTAPSTTAATNPPHNEDDGSNSNSASTTTETTTTTAEPDEVQAIPLSELLNRIGGVLLRILAAAAVIALFFLIHLWIVTRRSKAMQSSDPNRAAQASYLFLMQLLHMQGLDQKKLSHDVFAAQAETECKLLPAGRISGAFAIQQAAVFSREGISKADAKIIRSTAEELAAAMYKKANPIVRLWLRFARHIVK